MKQIKHFFEEESTVDGVVLECFYKEGDEVPVLENMMIIGQSGEDYSALLAESQLMAGNHEEIKKVEVEVDLPEAAIGATQPQIDQESVSISPRAKKLAEKLAEKEVVNVSSISGTGPHGRIIENDVKAVVENRPMFPDRKIWATVYMLLFLISD